HRSNRRAGQGERNGCFERDRGRLHAQFVENRRNAGTRAGQYGEGGETDEIHGAPGRGNAERSSLRRPRGEPVPDPSVLIIRSGCLPDTTATYALRRGL